MNNNELAGRTALVTGGSRGIGRAVCQSLAEAGANVAINYAENQDAAQQTADIVRAAGQRAMICQADVSLEEQVNHMVSQVHSELGPVELLVNNAGIFDYVSHAETTADLWQKTLDVNLTGTYLVTWAVKSSMQSRGFGRIVNVSSIAGLRARPMSIAYAASKAGVIGFTRSLAQALAPDGIRVNAIAPGLIETEILSGVDARTLDQLVADTPLGKIGQPQDIADLAIFLLSDQSRFMTGQTLVASGGRVTLP